MEAFSHALVPTVAALTAAAGAPAGAAAGQLASMLFSGVLVTAVDGLLLPLVSALSRLAREDARWTFQLCSSRQSCHDGDGA